MPHTDPQGAAPTQPQAGPADSQLYETLYAACLAAAQQMGPRIKQMSWFVSNWPAPPTQRRDS